MDAGAHRRAGRLIAPACRRRSGRRLVSGRRQVRAPARCWQRAAAGEALRATLARGADAMLAELQASRLRGRGGAGFATADKWALCAPRRCPTADARGRVQRRRRRARHLQGPRAAVAAGRHRLRGHDRGRPRAGRAPGLRLPARRVPLPADPLQAVLARRRAAGLLGAGIGGVAGFDFDIADPPRRRRLCLRRGERADRVAGRQARHAAHPAAVPGGARLPGPADGGQQRRDLLRGGAHRAARRRLVGRASAPVQHRHARSTRSAATANGPASTSTRSGTASAEILDDCGARDTQAVQVGGPSGVCAVGLRVRPPHGLRGRRAHRRRLHGLRPLARHVRGGARLRHFFAHESCGFCTPCRVGTELVVRRWTSWPPATARAFDIDVLHELEAAAARRHALRPGRHRLQPAARHHAPQVPPAYAAAEVAALRTRPSTSTPSSVGARA
jgi:[NiFe] hydrogenase diaphorase moiety large subunit